MMCSRRSVQLRGRALVGKDLQLPSCCRAVKMRMTGSISCCRKRTYGPLLQPGALSLRRSPNRSFVRSGAGCRPSICGWRSSCGGVCLLTECTPRPPLGSPKKNSMLCFLTGLPGAATRIRMKKKLIVDLQSKKSKHGGGNAKSGCHTSKVKVRRWSSTFFLLHAAKVRSSCEEGPGQSALQSAYHNLKLDVTELKQNRTP